ncbi:MAG: EamA family transporter [Candidatus Poribacteria bacterium]
MKSESKGIFALVISAFLWSTGGIFIKLVDWNGFAISGTRSLIASLVLLAYLRKPKFSFSFPQLSAAFASACTMTLYVLANKLTTAANTILLQYTAPIYVAILAWIILKEKPSLNNWIALAIISLGMTLFFAGKLSTGNMTGNILAILSGVGLAFFTVFMRMQKGNSPYESYLLAHFITFIASIPFIFKAGLPEASGWLGILMLGIFQTGFTSLSFSYGIKQVPALKAMLILTLEPILNPIWVFLFAGEVPGINAIIGGIFIIGAVLFTTIYSAKREKAT